jgi:hypothetical protein
VVFVWLLSQAFQLPGCSKICLRLVFTSLKETTLRRANDSLSRNFAAGTSRKWTLPQAMLSPSLKMSRHYAGYSIGYERDNERYIKLALLRFARHQPNNTLVFRKGNVQLEVSN